MARLIQTASPRGHPIGESESEIVFLVMDVVRIARTAQRRPGAKHQARPETSHLHARVLASPGVRINRKVNERRSLVRTAQLLEHCAVVKGNGIKGF